MAGGNKYLGEPIALTGRYTLVRAAILVIAAVLLAKFQRSTSIEQLTRMAERNNTDLTITLANSIWPRFSDFANEARRLTPDQILRHARTGK